VQHDIDGNDECASNEEIIDCAWDEFYAENFGVRFIFHGMIDPWIDARPSVCAK